ncbi:MAG: (Fe-S)-binding protein, partial [Methermicoccaceae archaeon]
MKLNSPLEVYKYLPQTNCGECGETTCMAFAARLIDRGVALEQ